MPMLGGSVDDELVKIQKVTSYKTAHRFFNLTDYSGMVCGV